jgi:hypothetical protein
MSRGPLTIIASIEHLCVATKRNTERERENLEHIIKRKKKN